MGGLQDNTMTKQHILVAGGAGFIGSHVCDALISSGRSVICLDDLSTGTMENIRHLLFDPRFEFVEGDVTRPGRIDCDAILNFACAASPIAYQKDPIRTLRVNFEGTRRLLDLARSNKALFIQASTSEVYGDPEVHPQVEPYRGSVNTTGPRSCYDEGKRVAEALCHAYTETAGVEVKIVRIFNTYGPRMGIHDGRVIPEFIVNALTGNELRVNGTGEQTRSFCYISDMVAGILATMQTTNVFRGPVNIGNPSEISITSLATAIVALTGSQSPIKFSKALTDDPTRRCPDIGLAISRLNWPGPLVGLKEGLQKTIQHFSEILSSSKDAPLGTSIAERPVHHADWPAPTYIDDTTVEADSSLHFRSGNCAGT
ncbi:NAD-dependent epimerase/dehydratase family protein [Burkholderia multivorans]|uniref:NAD-dependent epimerase/dehydratase family protein n=2 Tax=Burkholderia multivorans TaxID=87883 RepID=UPI00027820AD|nr:NAD dependent epimerase/dehydratase domain protein [Burkholderia multivorans CF2]